MLKIEDFKRGDTRYTDFETVCEIWGMSVRADAAFEEELGKTEETLAAALPAINDKIAFIEQHADEIKSSTIDDAHLDELANDWLADGLDDEELDSYEDMTAEQFTALLYPVSVGFEFCESTECCQAFLELLCEEPDPFAGHRIHIEIDEENAVTCEGI